MRAVCAGVLATVLAGLVAAGAPAKTSHEGWPKIDGVLFINRTDKDVTRHGTARSDELLGGHGNDTLYGEDDSDVLWGDHKPSGQTGDQFDHLFGGAGRDFIYASHGKNTIDAGPGNDWLKAHYGRGTIDCGSGKDVLYVSHRAQKKYKIRHCETISHKTLGYCGGGAAARPRPRAGGRQA
jgi:Ca2+-binding RTX toxin-like protein